MSKCSAASSRSSARWRGRSEGHYLHELAELEEAHQEESTRISAALVELEEELAAFDLVVDDLARRATPQPALVESPYEGAGSRQF